MTVQTEGFRKSADYETDYFEALHHSNSHSMLAHLSGMSPGFRKRRRSYAASSALQDRMGPGGGDFDLGEVLSCIDVHDAWKSRFGSDEAGRVAAGCREDFLSVNDKTPGSRHHLLPRPNSLSPHRTRN